MKVRIEENSLRLRLKQKEVEEFYNNGKISSSTRMGIKPDEAIRFSLIRDSSEQQVKVNFETNHISIIVPEKVANEWTQSDLEGFEAKIALEKNHVLLILVEKDFRCLHKEPKNKEDIDSFPNPLENGIRC